MRCQLSAISYGPEAETLRLTADRQLPRALKMPTFQFEAMDSTGAEIKDVIEAATEEDAQATIRQMGYFVTKITVKKSRKKAERRGWQEEARLRVRRRRIEGPHRLHAAALDSARRRACRFCAACGFLPARPSPADSSTRSKTPATKSKPVRPSPKPWPRAPSASTALYVNMIKAGEAGGALELILQRLADFQERAESLKRKVKGAMIYPIVVMTVAVCILTFIMIKIVPEFEKIFDEFDLDLPPMTLMLVADLELDASTTGI